MRRQLVSSLYISALAAVMLVLCYQGLRRLVGHTATCTTPAGITGQLYIAKDGNSQLANATGGGTWSSTTTAVATVDGSGLVIGVAAGTSTISYSTGAGCLATTVVTVAAVTLVGTPLAVWDAAIQPSVAIGTGVSSVGDRSGNSRPLLQATGANQPLYVNDGGHSYITFDGVTTSAGDFMQAAFTLSQPYTLILVVRQHWLGGQTLLGGVTADNRGQVYMNPALPGSPSISLVALSAIAPTSTALTDNTWKVLTIIFNGASSQISVNNAGTVTGSPGTASAGGVTLGRDAITNTTGSNIDVKFMAVFSGALSGGDQTSNYNALAAYKP